MTLTLDALALATVIFVLRIFNNTIGTLRLIFVARQRRLLAAVFGFIEALIFAVVMASVVTDLTNFLNLMAYCLGFSVGGYLGMMLESRLVTSYMAVNAIISHDGHEIAALLREHGFGVTETIGEGRDGNVTILRSVVIHRDMPRLLGLLRDRAPSAFVSIEEARSVQLGWIRPLPDNRR